MLEVEIPLIEGQLAEIDEQLQKAITELNWTSEGDFLITVTLIINLPLHINYVCTMPTVNWEFSGVWEYIQKTRDKVCDLERRVRLSKANVEHIRTIMRGWSDTPLYQRKDDKKDTLLCLEVCWNNHVHVHVQSISSLSGTTWILCYLHYRLVGSHGCLDFIIFPGTNTTAL